MKKTWSCDTTHTDEKSRGQLSTHCIIYRQVARNAEEASASGAPAPTKAPQHQCSEVCLALHMRSLIHKNT